MGRVVGLRRDASKKFESRRRGDLLVVLRHSYRRWDSTFKGQMYAKIFRQIYDSSIADNWKTRVVFQDLIVLADSDGVIDMTPNAIAARTRYPIEMVLEAIEELQKPDAHSRTHEKEGRRIELIDPHRNWGWRIINYVTYREMQIEFDRKSYMRRYMQDYRKKPVKLRKTKSFTCKRGLNSSPSPSTSSTEGGTRGNGKISATERIGLEKELASNRNILDVLSKDDFPDANQRAEKKRIKDRNKAIEKALHIPL